MLKKSIVGVFLAFMSSSLMAVETTPYGKITAIESRAWGMHINIKFNNEPGYVLGKESGCEVASNADYMLDLKRATASQTTSGDNFELLQSMVLAAFIAQKDVSFHLYRCGERRPEVGHVRMKSEM